MPIGFETGDIFATLGVSAFAHGCNCAGAMGKGIAVSFRERWPKMYEEYRRRCKAGEFKLGDVFIWEKARWCRGHFVTTPQSLIPQPIGERECSATL